MDLMTCIAEQRISEAEQRGELSRLPGEGRPQQLDDLSGVPRELRPAYLMLKNAGFVPPELHARQSIRDVEDLLDACADEDVDTRRRLSARLAILQARLEKQNGRRLGSRARMQYGPALSRRFG